jgi:hypothetical protein
MPKGCYQMELSCLTEHLRILVLLTISLWIWIYTSCGHYPYTGLLDKDHKICYYFYECCQLTFNVLFYSIVHFVIIFDVSSNQVYNIIHFTLIYIIRYLYLLFIYIYIYMIYIYKYPTYSFNLSLRSPVSKRSLS